MMTGVLVKRGEVWQRLVPVRVFLEQVSSPCSSALAFPSDFLSPSPSFTPCSWIP